MKTAGSAWANPPGFLRLIGEATGYGALFGGLLGSATFIFQGEPVGILLGVLFGIVYGAAFGLGAWAIGWLFIRSGLISTKGAALGWGVVTAAFIYPIALRLMGGTLEIYFILIPAAIAAVVGLVGGRAYDRRVSTSLS